MRITYDQQADALYIELHPLAAGTAQARELSEEIVADYGPDGKLAGLEILDVSAVLDQEPQHLVLEVAPLLMVKAE